MNDQDYIIELGRVEDIDELAELYGALNDHLAAGINYSGWSRSRYPLRQTAVDGVANGWLFVLRTGGHIAATVVLKDHPEPGYEKGNWQVCCDDSQIRVLHTVATHPAYFKRGYSGALMEFAKEYARSIGVRALQLDVCDYNTPAIGVYERAGFKCVGKLDLFGKPPPYHLYRLYEFVL